MKRIFGIPEKFPSGITLSELSKNWMDPQEVDRLSRSSITDKVSSLAIRTAYWCLDSSLRLNRCGKIGIATDIFERGYSPGNSPDEIHPVYRKNHGENTVSIGTTCTGKSSLARHLAEQDIKKGNSVVFFDSKGDLEILTSLAKTAYECGRRRDLVFINPFFPEYSAKINPIASGFLPKEQTHHILSAVNNAHDDVFQRGILIEVFQGILMSLLFLQNMGIIQEKPLKTDSIGKYLSTSALTALHQDIVNIASNTKITQADIILKKLASINDCPPEYLSKALSGLRKTISELSTGQPSRVISYDTESNSFLRKIVHDIPVILIVQSSGSYMKYCNEVAKMVLAMIHSVASRKLNQAPHKPHPVSIYLDDAIYSLIPEVSDFFATSKQTNFHLHLNLQSIDDCKISVGTAAARTILENTHNKIFFKVNDPSTCEYVSLASGTVKVLDHLCGLGRSMTSREAEKCRIKPEDVTLLEKRQFFMFSSSGIHFGVTDHVKPVDRTELIKFPEGV